MTIFGGHVNISKGLISASEYAHNLGYSFFQIFLRNKISLDAGTKDEKVLMQFKNNLEKFDQKMVIHGSYCINLCHPPKSDSAIKMRKCLLAELKNAHNIGERCLGAIIHMGANTAKLNISEDEAMCNFAENIDLVLEESNKNGYGNSFLILETSAGEGNDVCVQLNKLFEMYEAIIDTSRIKFCIDTCHIFAAGYNISTKEGVKEYFDTFEFYWNLNKIACFHLNDSKKECGCKADRHEDLTFGKIGEEGLSEIVKFATKNNIPLVTETPGDNVTVEVENQIILNWMCENEN